MAENPASLGDLQSRALRTLSTIESTAAPVWLDDAYNKLITQLPSVETRLDAGSSVTFINLVVATVCAMVMRVFNNPDGLLEEGVDDYTSRRDSTTSSGVLYATDDELALLAESGGSANAFTIAPVGRTPDATWTPDRVMFW